MVAFRLLRDTSSSAIAETALQGMLVMAKSGKLEQGYNMDIIGFIIGGTTNADSTASF